MSEVPGTAEATSPAAGGAPVAGGADANKDATVPTTPAAPAAPAAQPVPGGGDAGASDDDDADMPRGAYEEKIQELRRRLTEERVGREGAAARADIHLEKLRAVSKSSALEKLELQNKVMGLEASLARHEHKAASGAAADAGGGGGTGTGGTGADGTADPGESKGAAPAGPRVYTSEEVDKVRRDTAAAVRAEAADGCLKCQETRETQAQDRNVYEEKLDALEKENGVLQAKLAIAMGRAEAGLSTTEEDLGAADGPKKTEDAQEEKATTPSDPVAFTHDCGQVFLPFQRSQIGSRFHCTGCDEDFILPDPDKPHDPKQELEHVTQEHAKAKKEIARLEKDLASSQQEVAELKDKLRVPVKPQLVHFLLVNGRDVPIGDKTGSDCFCKIAYGTQNCTSPVIDKTVNPDWGVEVTFDYELHEVIVINVYDKDRFSDDLLGTCTVSLDDFRIDQKNELTLPIDTGSGNQGVVNLQITCSSDAGTGPVRGE